VFTLDFCSNKVKWMLGEVVKVTGPYFIMCALVVVYLTTNRKWGKFLNSDLYTERLKAFFVNEAHRVKKC